MGGLQKVVFGFAVFAGLWAHPAFGQEVDVQKIVQKANHVSYYTRDDGRAKVNMRIVDAQGRERLREFVILRKDGEIDDAKQKFYVYFNKPSDVKKMVFLVSKNIDRSDDRWLYLPALDLVKRIAASDERTSFVGSHFYYEDVSGRGVAEDSHVLLETTDKYYIVKSTPKDAKSVEFSMYKSWIHKTSFLPVKTEYYNAAGDKIRSYTAMKVEMVSGHPTVTSSKMHDHEGGGTTFLTYSGVKYDAGLPDSIFTERYLRKTPRKYLK